MNNYYAIDPCKHAVVRDEMLAKILASSGGKWFALIDRAFDHGSKQFGENLENDCCLYRDGRLQNLGGVSPCLIELNTLSTEKLTVFLGRLLFHCRRRPMLSFIQSARAAEKLVEDWQGLLEVKTEDEQAFLLRFADTRVLPQLTSCTKTLWADLSRNIDEWWIINRAGELEALPLLKSEAVPGSNFGRASINAKDFACLLESGLPDALADQLHEHFPNLLVERSGAANYQLLRSCCDLAKRLGLEAFPEQMALSVAVLFSQGRLLEDPQFESWMKQKPWSDGSLEATLGDYLEKMEATQ